jgi:serine/threonine-protein kinase
MIGEWLGNYRITAKLGSGTMGVVFRAEHARIARTAAIKVLRPELALNDALLQRFFIEARATSLIRHPGIVEVLDCGVDDGGRAYIVMEHLDGETLADRIRRSEGIPWAVACQIAGEVAETVAAAHDNAIVHRDLKPENVFLVRDAADPTRVGAIKVLDFGIAKLLTPETSVHLTMRGMLLGTPEYMAPEQCRATEEIDGRADIYALGCILFEMLSGAPPFKAASAQELIVGHMFRPVPAVGERVAGLPAAVAGLVARMMAKRRDERPASMHEVARALEEVTTVEGASPRPAADESAAERAAAPATPVAARATAARWGGRKTVVAMAIGGALALAGALWIGRGAKGRSSPVGGAHAAALPTPMEAARLAPPLAPPAPPPMPATIDPAPAPAAPSMRKRARAAAPPQRPARRAPSGVPAPAHGMDTDGIVDL